MIYRDDKEVRSRSRKLMEWQHIPVTKFGQASEDIACTVAEFSTLCSVISVAII